MQRRIIKNVLQNVFLLWTAFLWLKIQWFPVFNVVMKWYVAYGTIYTDYRMLRIDVDRRCQRQVMRNLRTGL